MTLSTFRAAVDWLDWLKIPSPTALTLGPCKDSGSPARLLVRPVHTEGSGLLLRVPHSSPRRPGILYSNPRPSFTDVFMVSQSFQEKQAWCGWNGRVRWIIFLQHAASVNLKGKHFLLSSDYCCFFIWVQGMCAESVNMGRGLPITAVIEHRLCCLTNEPWAHVWLMRTGNGLLKYISF